MLAAAGRYATPPPRRRAAAMFAHAAHAGFAACHFTVTPTRSRGHATLPVAQPDAILPKVMPPRRGRAAGFVTLTPPAQDVVRSSTSEHNSQAGNAVKVAPAPTHLAVLPPASARPACAVVCGGVGVQGSRGGAGAVRGGVVGRW